MYNDRHENMDRIIDVKQKTCKGFNESHVEKLAQLDNSKVETNQNGNEWLDKFPVTQHTEALDIEEGQIITEAINVNPVKKICASADVGQISDVKKLNGEKAKNGYAVVEKNNPRILEVIAKMEKRRERFKEPITLRNDADRVVNPPVDSVVETAQNKQQQRPMRKRRWGGS
ncbi:unnamed protein product [Ilex paraguariensis]|uniref:Uncharacterized protein n=1 Tax=Ilex paraguariensis TaxID=185542 RepID=A0ABC8RRP7_9AQUA